MSAEEWIKRNGYIYMHAVFICINIYINTMGYYSKKKEIPSFVTVWIYFEGLC